MRLISKNVCLTKILFQPKITTSTLFFYPKYTFIVFNKYAYLVKDPLQQTNPINNKLDSNNIFKNELVNTPLNKEILELDDFLENEIDFNILVDYDPKLSKLVDEEIIKNTLKVDEIIEEDLKLEDEVMDVLIEEDLNHNNVNEFISNITPIITEHFIDHRDNFKEFILFDFNLDELIKIILEIEESLDYNSETEDLLEEGKTMEDLLNEVLNQDESPFYKLFNKLLGSYKWPSNIKFDVIQPYLISVFFLVIRNLVQGLLNPNNKLFLKTINYSYNIYWALFTYQKEKYYKNFYKNIQNYDLYSSFNLVEDFEYDTKLDIISNYIQLKKNNTTLGTNDRVYQHKLVRYFNLSQNYYSNKQHFLLDDEIKDDFVELSSWILNPINLKFKINMTINRDFLIKLLGFRLKRKKQVTNKLIKFVKHKIRNNILNFELALINIMNLSKLGASTKLNEKLIGMGFIYLNGKVSTKCNKILKKNDIINVVFSTLYYEFYNWYHNLHTKCQHKYFNKFFANSNKDPENSAKNFFSRKGAIPKWLDGISNFTQPVPQYLEVDLTTLSAIILYTPPFFNQISFVNSQPYNIFLKKLYNWKFLT